MSYTKNVLKLWLPLVVITTGICGLVYLTTQQLLRMGANDPQIQMAEDTAAVLENGSTPAEVVKGQAVDVASSPAPFLVIYNNQGVPQASNARLHEELPELPSGVFQYVKENGEDRITWQPEPGVRIAAVVVGFQGDQAGFVMAGRSLRESESRTDQIGMIVAAAWVVIMMSSLVAVILMEMVFSHMPS